MSQNLQFFYYTSHVRKVKSLYKRVLRDIEAWNSDRAISRYKQSLMRAQFDKNKDVSTELAQKLIDVGEEELFKKCHYVPIKFMTSPGGTSYNRKVEPPDWILDYWHPLEKAQYPEYFSRRELRKREFVKAWEEKYGETKTFTQH